MSKNHAEVKTIPPLIPLLAIFISWLIDNYIYSLKIPLSGDTQSILAYVCMVFASVFIISSLYFFAKYKQNPEPHTPTRQLYTGGIYRISRNPIYLGFLLAQIVVAVKFNNLYVIISLPLVALLLNQWVIKPEEIYLQNQFGKEYQDYKNKVRRWI